LPNGNKNNFELLKLKIVAVMQRSYPGINPVISEWRGQEITDFQEELRHKVNAHISEKWFYNHFKNKSLALPRIDMLNLLSRYAGYLNWDDFLYRNNLNTGETVRVNRGNRFFIYMPLLVVTVVFIFFLLYQLISTREYNFSFHDALTREAIYGSQIAITIISDKESPVSQLSDSSGTITLKTDKRVVRMVVSAPYFRTDTILRTLKTFEKEQKIGLHSDDYARMILCFSEMNLTDWQKRRASLDSIIDDNAMIYQVGSGSRHLGVELFNKHEFIDKLTMPAGSLKNMDVLETQLKSGKIAILRFRVNSEIR
jgi:hypothetical protein